MLWVYSFLNTSTSVRNSSFKSIITK